MEEEIKNRLDMQAEKIDEIYAAVKKAKRYFLIHMIMSIVIIAVPLIGLFFVLPQFITSYLEAFNQLK